MPLIDVETAVRPLCSSPRTGRRGGATRTLLLVGVASTIAATVQAALASPQVLANVAAFARLYGVVRYFYPSDAATAVDWDRYAVYGVTRVLRARDSAALALALRELFTPLGPGIEIAPHLPSPPAAGAFDPSLVAWRYTGPAVGTSAAYTPYSAMRTNRPSASRPTSGFGKIGWNISANDADTHIDFDVTRGLKARVRLALTDADARAEAAALADLRRAVSAVEPPGGRSDTAVRLADVVVAWNVFRHFYPYWRETRVDWDARLAPQLETAYSADARETHRRALQQLVADAQDGHGVVTDSRGVRPVSLPIQLRVIDGRLVITASSMPTEAPVGAAVTAINGASATERLADEVRLASGTLQWKQWRAVREIAVCPRGAADVQVALEIPGSPAREISLPCDHTKAPAESRPARTSELARGIWYIDLTRATWTDVAPNLPTFASASGVVFDVRGYPTDAGGNILPHLLDTAENDRWMHIANIVGPFGRIASWKSIGWNVKPSVPHFSGRLVFLTDGRAISYAESVMGYVADRKLGTIIGSTTAGANGNVVGFQVPGGFTIGFTGMRVTGHDGETPHHLVGVRPDIVVEPTLTGVRNMRDEVLERALAILGDSGEKRPPK